MKIAEATILVVDDEPELLEIFSVWLRRTGCTVLTAVNGAEALKILTAQPVNALVSDIRMPIMDGVSLVRRLFELGIHVPSIIFVSGFGDIDAREVYALGVEAMLAKPLSRQQFMQVLEDSLKDRGEMWTRLPNPGTVEQLTASFKDRASSKASCAFILGRGGCCLTTEKQLTEDQPIHISIHFRDEGLHLEAHGIVRWYNAQDRHAGIEFTYLSPDSRKWVLDAIKGSLAYSFIPRC